MQKVKGKDIPLKVGKLMVSYHSKGQLVKCQSRKSVSVLLVVSDSISRRLTGMPFKKPQFILECKRIGFPFCLCQCCV